MELASAQLQRPGKGEDGLLVRSVDVSGSAKLLAVADGLSLSGGKAAAQWVIDFLAHVENIDSPRKIFTRLKEELAGLRDQQDQSETTLTCGILREIGTDENMVLRFDYFAIGDSPIWKVVSGNSRYPFQRMLVHGSPYPAETARVYSTVRLHMGDIQGAVMFGSVEISPGEVLVLCTDGIPEREVFVRDFSRPIESGASVSSLCHWLFQPLPYQDDGLAEVLGDYDRRGVLFDDATIIAARSVQVSVNSAGSCNATATSIACEEESATPQSKVCTEGDLPVVEAAKSSSDLDVITASDAIAQGEGELRSPRGNHVAIDSSAPVPAGSPQGIKSDSAQSQDNPQHEHTLAVAPEHARSVPGKTERSRRRRRNSIPEKGPKGEG